MDYGLTSPQPSVAKNQKQMLSRDEQGNYKINFSSLSLIQSCLRKTQYNLALNLRSENESPALTFGKAIHRGLEYWYCLPRDQRLLDTKLFKNELELLGVGMGTEEAFSNGPLEAIRQFVSSAQSLLSLPDGDKRSVEQGVKILKNYFEHYKNDPFIVMRDDQGPLIERSFEFPITPKVTYFGTIDCILRNEETGLIFVADHKTTTSLGQQLLQRTNPNHQYTGYILAAQKCFGLDTNDFMVNGIQVAKTKQEFARFFTKRSEDDFRSLEEAVLKAINDYERCLEIGYWPQTAPGPCSDYGGCPYIDACSVPESMRKTVLEAKYGNIKQNN